MKKIFLIVPVLLLFVSAVVYAQTRTVTINVMGNRINRVAVDDRMYSVTNTSVNSESTINITGLATGQHELDIYRTNSTRPTTTTFSLREGYDLEITINANGSVSLSETRSRVTSGINNQKPMSAAAFKKLYNSTKAKTSSTARTSFLRTEFDVDNRYLTSNQARQLIALVNSESSRLTLAKEVYPIITDQNNFSLVSNLLKSSSNRNELNTYIAALPDDESEETNPAYVAMTSAKFNEIYNEVLNEPQADRNYYLSNFFNKEYNYFTSAQVRQFLQLISSESERMELAKLAYRGVTDRGSYYNEIYPLLNSNASRTDLRNYLNTYDTNNNTRVAMTATAYNSLYQTIYNQGTTARYNSVYNAFNTSENYFTSAQARQLIGLISDEGSKLSLAKMAYTRLIDPTNYTIMNDLFSYQSSRSELASYVSNYNSGNTTTPGTNTGAAMSDADFNSIYRNVNAAWTSTNKFSTASTAFQGTTNKFTVSQVRQLLSLITSESDKLALAKMAFDNMVDQHNHAMLNDVFTSTENRTEWTRYVNDIQTGGTGTTYRTPMTESSYNSMYRSVQLTFGFGAKMSSLTDIFNTETNYFTVAQIKELVKLVSNESNRLELAKLAYNNAVDPTNYNNLYDIFTSQTSKDELTAYISTYNR